MKNVPAPKQDRHACWMWLILLQCRLLLLPGMPCPRAGPLWLNVAMRSRHKMSVAMGPIGERFYVRHLRHRALPAACFVPQREALSCPVLPGSIGPGSENFCPRPPLDF